MKTSEELIIIRQDCEELRAKLAELTEEELFHVCGGDEEQLDSYVETIMVCTCCPYITYWAGNHKDEVHKCPCCNHDLIGKYVRDIKE